MARLYNDFDFTGEIVIPKEDSKFYEAKKFPSGWQSSKVKFAMKESKTNSVFVEIFGGINDKVFSFGKGTESQKGEKLEIPWEARNEESTMDMVADFKKFIVDFTTDTTMKEKASEVAYKIRSIEYKDEKTEDDLKTLKELKEEYKQLTPDRHEFIAEYDMIQFLHENLKNYTGHKFNMKGSFEMTEWKGKFYTKYKPQSIEIVPNDTKNKFKAVMNIFFNRESMDDMDFEEEKKVYINGFVQSYVSKEGDKFFPLQFVINAAKLDMENPKHVGMFNVMKKYFTVSNDSYYNMQWNVNIYRGAEKVEFTEADLTPTQKEQVEFFGKKVEDFAPKGGLLGANIEEFRLVSPTNHQDFADGAVETEYEEDDFIFKTTEDVNTDDMIKDEKKDEETAPEVKEEEDIEEDLFG